MCGIGGVIMFPKDRYSWELAFIKKIVETIAVESQSRGRDATGLVAFNKENTKVFKAPQMASKFVSTETYKNFVDESINHDTHSILIHTRAGTKGTEQNNDNNHPIESREFVGVHNGMIYNDDELFIDEKLFRLAEVDSEAIFRMHDKYGNTINGIKKVAEKLEGAFTYSFAHKDQRNLLYLVRNNNPVTMVYIPILKIIAFASERRFLESALFSLQHFIPEDMCHWIEPKRGTIMVFDSESDTAFDQFTSAGVPFSPSYSSSSIYDEWVEDEMYGWIIKRPEKKNIKTNTQKEDQEVEDMLKDIFYLYGNLLCQYLDREMENAWNKGWTAGRASLDEPMKLSKSLAYEQGFERGKDEGFEAGMRRTMDAMHDALESEENETIGTTID